MAQKLYDENLKIKDTKAPAEPSFDLSQRAMMDALDWERTPEAVVACCQEWIGKLRAGRVDLADLVIEKRFSKSLEQYTQRTHTVGALERYRALGIEKRPGQHIEYVVVDDNVRRTGERVRVACEPIEEYDAEWYSEQLRRACESIVSPLGWSWVEIEQYLRERADADLTTFG